MKFRPFRSFAALVLTLVLLPVSFPAALAVESPAVSCNVDLQNYGKWAQPATSFLYANEKGGLTRVEGISGEIAVEDYDRSFSMVNSRRIPIELEAFHGFFAGKDYNFLIFGQWNLQEDDAAEVIRVVKYSKDWKRLGQAALSGSSTQIPFESGTVRCTENNGYLYLHTCHKLYASPDGQSRQTSLGLEIRQGDMAITCRDVGNDNQSFNQFALVDQDKNLVFLDHGSSSPRGVVLAVFPTGDGFIGAGKECVVQPFAGEAGQTATGASLGGFAETAGGYVSAFNYDDNAVKNVDYPRDIYIGFTSKNSLQSTVTRISSGVNTSTPMLAAAGLDGGYILWNDRSENTVINGSILTFPMLKYVTYSSSGATSPIQTAYAHLSDCQPISYNGKIVWYVTIQSVPTFYILDASGVKAVTASSGMAAITPAVSGNFRDVPDNHWAAASISRAVAEGVTTGYADGTFRPSSAVTYAQFCTFLSRAFYPADPGDAKPWYQPYTQILLEKGIFDGTALEHGLTGNIEKTISRYDMAQMLYNIMKEKNRLPAENTLTTARSGLGKVFANYKEAAAACYAAGLMQGVSGGSFGGEQAVSRAQACVVICRLKDWL